MVGTVAWSDKKQRELIEDAALIYKIQNAPERKVWVIDTGNMSHERARVAISKFKEDLATKALVWDQEKAWSFTGRNDNMTEHRYQPVVDWMKERVVTPPLGRIDHHTMLDEEGVLHLLDKVIRTRHNMGHTSYPSQNDEECVHTILMNRSCNMIAKQCRKARGNCIIPCSNGIMVTYAADLDNRAWRYDDIPGIYIHWHDMFYTNIQDLSNYFLFWEGNTIDILNLSKEYPRKTNHNITIVQNQYTEQGRGVMKW